MLPEHLAVLHRNESTVGVQAMSAQKDHLAHRGPLSVVPDDDPPPARSSSHRRRKSWTRSFAQLARLSKTPAHDEVEDDEDPLTRDSYFKQGDADKPLKDRVLTWASTSPASTPGHGLRDSTGPAESYATRLTMTSRAAFVQVRSAGPTRR